MALKRVTDTANKYVFERSGEEAWNANRAKALYKYSEGRFG
jgi:hypothetical protein